jgi:hypothetical protein
MINPSPDPTDLGGLWRDVVNHLGDGEIQPSIYLPLLRGVLPRWGGWTYFLGRAKESLTKDRAELEADAARAKLGWLLWTERRDGLRRFAESVAERPVPDEEVEAWWIRDERGLDGWTSLVRGIENAGPFVQALGITSGEERVIDYHPEIPAAVRRRRRPHDWLVSWISQDLEWIDDLETLRTLARKTWPGDERDRQHWTQNELDFVNAYYEEQQPSLFVPDNPAAIDPFELDTLNIEQNLGIGLDGLRYCMYVLLRATVADFVDSILERSRRPSARGSLRCIECGLFVGRRALGYGQLYCTETCKKRAAKRRYRALLAASRTGPRLSVVK